MTENTYIQEQIKRTKEAIRMAEGAREIASEIREFIAVSREGEGSAKKDFAEDTLKYFDTSFVQGQIEKLYLALSELKKKMIEIKISNDRLLFEGGFLLCIDQKIDVIFLSNTLCKLQADDEKATAIMDDTIRMLRELLSELSESL